MPTDRQTFTAQELRAAAKAPYSSDLRVIYGLPPVDLGAMLRYAAEMRARLDGREWQPIATAPLDGTNVLLCWQNGIAAPMFDVGHCLGRNRAWQTTHRIIHNLQSFPTHWKPLDAAPVVPAETEP